MQVDLGVVPERSSSFEAMAAATAHLDPPFAVVDRRALAINAHAMLRRAGGTPIRLASKSVRCRAISTAVLALPGYRGVLALTLPEALWLAGSGAVGGRDDGDHENRVDDDGVDDVVVGYPSVDVGALTQLGRDDTAARRVTLMIDDVDQLDLTEDAAGPDAPPLRVCLDLDASLRLAGGRVNLGPRRSPVHTADEATALAREVLRRPRFALVGLMSYEGQIAGLGDAGRHPRQAAVRAMQRRSGAELRERRAAVVEAVRALAPLEFVNGGGTGSLEQTASEPSVTEVAAGSGLYSPALFDHYRGFRHEPAAFFVLPVVRRPSRSVATVAGGGWIASGATGPDRSPTPVWPPGLALTAAEGAGEAQTPLRGPGASALRIGERVWFRHAKAGELGEHVNNLHVVDGDRLVATVPTYRGEGRAFQ